MNENQRGKLYLLPVWLGDSDWPDVLPQASRATACSLQHFIVENAKSARAALKWLGHPLPLRELKIEQLAETPTTADIDRYLAPIHVGQNVGLMSEAGCPGVADPGAQIVRAAHLASICVRPLTGPSSLLLALMASGLDGQRFAFHGYLPRQDAARKQRIIELENESRLKQQTQLFIEAPYRNLVLFDALLGHCRSDSLLCVASELTSNSETITTLSIDEWRRLPQPDLSRRPCVFLLLSAG